MNRWPDSGGADHLVERHLAVEDDESVADARGGRSVAGQSANTRPVGVVRPQDGGADNRVFQHQFGEGQLLAGLLDLDVRRRDGSLGRFETGLGQTLLNGPASAGSRLRSRLQDGAGGIADTFGLAEGGTRPFNRGKGLVAFVPATRSSRRSRTAPSSTIWLKSAAISTTLPAASVPTK